MISKIKFQKDLAFVLIPKAIIELKGLRKGQKVDVRIVDEKIVIAPVTSCKQGSSRAAMSVSVIISLWRKETALTVLPRNRILLTLAVWAPEAENLFYYIAYYLSIFLFFIRSIFSN